LFIQWLSKAHLLIFADGRVPVDGEKSVLQSHYCDSNNAVCTFPSKTRFQFGLVTYPIPESKTNFG